MSTLGTEYNSINKGRHQRRPNDAAIYVNEMELLPQDIKVKMDILNQIQNRIESLEQEEARIRNDIHKMMIEGKMEHGVLSQRLVEIDRLDKTLMELQQNLMSMGTQIEKKAPKSKSNKTELKFSSKDIIGAIVAELEYCSSSISTT